MAIVAGAAVSATAQSTTASSPPSGPARADAPDSDRPQVQFLSRSVFHMGGEHLSGDDPQFVWEANFGGDIDFVDWGFGRATFVANYQVILGEEFKSFDPNQGNYILGASGSARIRGAEISGVFHHESRHLSDRLKRTAVDWNMAGARVQGKTTLGRMFVDAQGQFLGVIQKSYVDYNWEFDGGVRNDYLLRPGIGLLLDVDVKVLGVDGTRSRGTQAGARAEGGLRLDGPMAALELFLALERRVDPAPLEFGTVRWFTAGFRLSSR
jgi:hypothetical protein